MLDERLQADARAPTDDLDAERPEEGERRDFEIEQRLAGLLLRRLSFQQIPRIAAGRHVAKGSLRIGATPCTPGSGAMASMTRSDWS